MISIREHSDSGKEPKTVKELYPYQLGAIEKIMSGLEALEEGQNLIYQLPTGGGKTVIFSEIASRFIRQKQSKVLILTHRVELLHQTSRSLEGIGVSNKIIDRKVQQLDDQDQFSCFVAMVETLNNRLTENENYIKDVGLVCQRAQLSGFEFKLTKGQLNQEAIDFWGLVCDCQGCRTMPAKIRQLEEWKTPEDAAALIGADGIDVIIDATGDPLRTTLKHIVHHDPAG